MRERESKPHRVKNSQRSSTTISPGSHFFQDRSAPTNRDVKSCSTENYLKNLKYPPIIKWMVVRTLKSVRRPRPKVKKIRAFLLGRGQNVPNHRTIIQMPAHKLEVGQRMVTGRVSFQIYVEIKSTKLPSFLKVTNVAFHLSFLESVFSPQGDASESCPQ